MECGILIHLSICILGAISFEMAPELKNIFQAMSWSSKMKLLDKFYPHPNRANWSMNALLHTKGIDNIEPQPITPKVGPIVERKVAIEALSQPRELPARRKLPELPEDSTFSEQDSLLKDDESNMKTKLFRLMYETIRDSDLKVKRSELIKLHYTNSSSFEVGYLLGEVTEKFNIMTDIAVTVKRLFNEWKPIEHINAYEQIANQAIEISHLVDIVRTTHKVTKKKSSSTSARPQEMHT